MRKLAIFSASFALATAAYVWLLPPAPALVTAGFLLLAGVCLLFLRSSGAKRARLAAFGMAFGLLWSRGYEKIKLEPLRAHCGENVTITAEICDYPQTTTYGIRVKAKLDGGRILLYLNDGEQTLHLGDRVTITAEVVDVTRGSGDNNNLYYQSNDISLLGFQRGALTVQPAKHVPYFCYPKVAAAAFRRQIQSTFPDKAEGFALALLSGERSGLSYQSRNALSVAGLSHVIAVSGMHVSLIVGVLQFLCRRRRLAAVVSMAVMLFFAAMLGFPPSVTRAVIMNSVLLIAPLVRRENDPPTSLSAALFVILLFHPWAIANISLQLSFGAIVGIFLLAPHIYQWVMRAAQGKLLNRYRLLRRLFSAAALSVATTLGATLATLPLVAYAFGTVSLIAPISNLLLLPVVSLTFCFSFAATLLGAIIAPLGAVLGKILALPIRFLLWAVERLAQLPYAAVYTCSGYIVAWLVLLYVLLAVFLLQRKKRQPLLLCACILVSLCAACGLSSAQRGTTAVTVFDVGQGQSVLLRCGDFTALVDCGGDDGDENGEMIARKLLMSGHRRIDALILTHYDTDHLCGAAQLLRRVEVGELILPAVEGGAEQREALLAVARQTRTPYRFITADTTLQIDGGALLLMPPPNASENNACLSALMSAQEYDILITGDLPAAQERQLIKTHDFPELEVLVAGHHGAKNSTSVELLAALKPAAVAISVGRNRFGHPAQEVLDRISAAGASIYRTDINGEITFLR